MRKLSRKILERELKKLPRDRENPGARRDKFGQVVAIWNRDDLEIDEDGDLVKKRILEENKKQLLEGVR